MKRFVTRHANFIFRSIVVVFAVIFMGFNLSWLIRIDMGTDPCTCLNLGISSHLPISFGSWQLLLNLLLFLIVIRFNRRLIGLGTVANMVLVGYSADFFGWLWDRIIPSVLWEILWVRLLILVIAISLFVFSVAVYMTSELGTAPFDAVPFIIAQNQKKLSFRAVRMIWDLTAMAIGLITGSTFGIVTLIMAFTIGPVVAWMQPFTKKLLRI